MASKARHLPGLLQRSVILGFSRLLNQGLMLIAPVVLVRLLTIEEFGAYRELLLYAVLVGGILAFSVNRSLPYFIPRGAQDAPIYVTQALLFVLAFSGIGLGILGLYGGIPGSPVTGPKTQLIVLYVFFAINFDIVEFYWLAKKRTEIVLLYSASRIAARLVVSIGAAFLLSSAIAMFTALIIVEALRFVLVAAWCLKNNLLTLKMSRASLRRQMVYFGPLGIASIVITFNTNISKLFVSAEAGAASLALFVVGAYALPIAKILRGSIADVIFPEMVESHERGKQDFLRLWQRGVVAFCFLLFPLALILIVYAELIIGTLFGADYLEAVPVFRVCAALIAIRCFDFHLPLRVLNLNMHFLSANVLALLLSVVLLQPFYAWFGLMGPALTMLVAQVVLSGYLWFRLDATLQFGLREILPWSQIGKLFLAVGCSGLLMIAFDVDTQLVPSLFLCLAFLVTYLALSYVLGVSEFRYLAQKFRLLPKGQ